MGHHIIAARTACRLRQGPDWIQDNSTACRPCSATVAERRSALAAASFKGLSSRRNETSINRESGSRASTRAGIALRACQLPDGRQCEQRSENEPTSRRYHGSVRGCVDRAYWPAAEYVRALLGDRRPRANLAGVLY